MSETRINIGKKYAIVHENGGGLRAERYGQPWRDLVGDGLVLAMAQEIEALRQQLVEYSSGEALIGRAINDAATRLPDGWQIDIELECGAGTVYLLDPFGDLIDFDEDSEPFHEKIQAAIRRAIELAPRYKE